MGGSNMQNSQRSFLASICLLLVAAICALSVGCGGSVRRGAQEVAEELIEHFGKTAGKELAEEGFR